MTDVAAAETDGKKNSLATRVKAFEAELDLRTATFAQALPEHVPVAKFKRNLITAVVQTPDLLNCYRPSLFQAAMTAASLGLVLDPTLGHGYILPFKDGGSGRTLAQFIPGYRGYLHLARQSGDISSTSAYEVCKNDHFEYELGLHEKLEHKPALENRGDVTHAYCVIRYKDGGHHMEVMTRAEIDKIRARSKSKNSPAWRDDFPMMARKTVIRRAAKYMPLSVQRAAMLDAAYDAGRAARIENGDLVIDGEAFEIAEDQAPTAATGSKLERFEQAAEGEATVTDIDPDTGEIVAEPTDWADIGTGWDTLLRAQKTIEKLDAAWARIAERFARCQVEAPEIAAAIQKVFDERRKALAPAEQKGGLL